MRKNKWDIIGKNIDKDNHDDYIDYFYYWYDGEYNNYYNYCDNCGRSYCENYDHCQTYDYLEQSGEEVIYLSKSFGRWTSWRSHYPLHGRYIDMMSIYPKSILRQKKIDYLLGIDKFEIPSRPTIFEHIKYKTNNEKN